ncbi:methionine--tRNA ligase subunit beta [Candidatus Acetothermia bacterium]|nr:methionine--tRNA ligase subunit beta [Candidatus Acetothermia bacterium]MBI3643414.1 methionine--tRNA ligase subunit beta [Candidatus Acetothermia bacterium]
MITFDDFMKLDIRIGRIESAERVEGTDKLMKLTVNLGSESRQLVAGIAESYTPDSIIGKIIPVLANLEPRVIRGVESQGMILCPSNDLGKPVLLHPEREVPLGAKVK